MKRIAIVLMALVMVCAIRSTAFAVTPPAPSLTVTTDGITVSLSWTASAGADGYTLFYAPMDISYIGDIDMGNQTSFSIDLWDGASLYVAVKAYNSAGSSDYSNVEYFNIVGSGSTSIDTSGRVSLTAVENRLLELINGERNASGLPTLVRDPGLDWIIYWHVTNMATDHFLSHTDPNGRGAEDRARYYGTNSGIRCSEIIQW